ncbi:MAG: GtrA family protein [Hyphomonadaceae bacterium]
MLKFLQRVARIQFMRFLVVGAIATGVHFATLIALVELARVSGIAATSAGFIAGAGVSYTLNRAFTFAAAGTPYARGLALFLAVAAIGFVVNGAIFTALTTRAAPYLLAQAAATALVVLWSYAASRFIVFRR